MRQLAAIMFTDIVGYTALMGSDEDKAFEILNKNRQLQKPLIKQYSGTWIKELGDGVLASFNTASDAVVCAIKIQQNCLQVAGLELRIGIHLGEVVFENDDVFGDGVNIASRIQAIAPVGAVWITEAVHKNVFNKKEITSTFVKEEILKNVAESVRIYEIDLKLDGVQVIQDRGANGNSINARNKIPQKSIAVLPFINMSNDPDQEYFSEGMAEEILNSLAHLQDLKVAGRTSSFQFKGKNVGLREIGEKLGVSNVLEGSVRKQGNILRVTAQLIKVEDGFHLWSERYDRNMDDIFAIQDEIAFAITEKLRVTLMQNDRDKITKNYTYNTAAYDLYLKGRFYMSRRGPSILSGVECFKQAIEMDPYFAFAYAGYADALSLTASYALVHPKTVIQKVKDAAEKAISLDPEHSEPYCSLGFYYTFFERNWKKAKKNFLAAIELNPLHTQSHYWYGLNYLCWVEGDFEEAKKHGKIATQREPLSAICHAFYSLILHTSGNFNEALDLSKMAIELDGSSFFCHLSEGSAYMGLEQFDDAIISFQNTIRLSNNHQFPANAIIWAYCKAGDFEQANSLFQQLKERSEKEYLSSTLLGLSSGYLGDLDSAFTYFDKAINDYESLIISMKFDHWVPKTILTDPRYQLLLDKIGYP
jgi:pentatricopeptide repeat protein